MPNSGRINMGAHHDGAPEANRGEEQWLVGDMNHDGAVDMLDFGPLAHNCLNRENPLSVRLLNMRDGFSRVHDAGTQR